MLLAAANSDSGSAIAGLVGAFVGGGFSLGGTLLANYLAARREQSGHTYREKLAVHTDYARWWTSVELQFEVAESALHEAETAEPALGDAELGRVVLSTVQELLRLIPGDLRDRLFLYGDDEVARRMIGGFTPLLTLFSAARNQSNEKYYSILTTEGAADQRIRDRVELLHSSSGVHIAKSRFDSATSAIDLYLYRERKRLRGNEYLGGGEG